MSSPPVLWSEADDAKLRAEYPITGGSTWIRGKTPSAVRHRATFLGLRKEPTRRLKVGEKVGQRTVKEIGIIDAHGHRSVIAECECGKRDPVKESDLIAGKCLKCFACQVTKARSKGYNLASPGGNHGARRTA